MEQVVLAQKVDALLDELNRVDPVSYDLGSPELPEVSAFYELVDMGRAITPLLIERIHQPGSSKRIAYMVMALNRLGDIRALAPLRALGARYRAITMKNEWDYAVIGQCNIAIEALEKMGR
jgi:hypothetical protein